MDTLADIITRGNAAALSGAPFVNNWPQARGAIYMIGCAGGGLDQVRLTEFEERFPQDFEKLAMTIKMALPSKETYQLAHLQVTRVLIVLGVVDDPWERLRVLIRRAGRDHDIENALYALRRAALDAGLAPSDIQTDWVWSLDAELTGGAGAAILAPRCDSVQRAIRHPGYSGSGRPAG